MALRRHFLAGLERCDPVTGLNDDPDVLAFHALLYGTPALVARLHTHLERSEAALGRALGGDLDARLAAGQIVAVQRVLAQENWRRIAAGERAADVRGTRWRRRSGRSGCWRPGCRGWREGEPRRDSVARASDGGR